MRLLPLVMEEKVFAVHGGTAINLFLRNLPRYSVDIDLTYIPLADRKKSIDDINFHLKSISEKARKAFPGMHIIPNYATCKLLCEYRGKQVKVEVNQTKRGIVGGELMHLPLCEKAQDELDEQRISSGEMGTDDAQRRGDGGTRHDCEQTDGENGIQQSLFHNRRFKKQWRLQLYQAAKRAFSRCKGSNFFQKIHPDSRVTDCRGVIISINKEFTSQSPSHL